MGNVCVFRDSQGVVVWTSVPTVYGALNVKTSARVSGIRQGNVEVITGNVFATMATEVPLVNRYLLLFTCLHLTSIFNTSSFQFISSAKMGLMVKIANILARFVPDT